MIGQPWALNPGHVGHCSQVARTVMLQLVPLVQASLKLKFKLIIKACTVCGLLYSCGTRGCQVVVCRGSLLTTAQHSALTGIRLNGGLQLVDEIK